MSGFRKEGLGSLVWLVAFRPLPARLRGESQHSCPPASEVLQGRGGGGQGRSSPSEEAEKVPV